MNRRNKNEDACCMLKTVRGFLALALLSFIVHGCSGSDQFSQWHNETFPETAITESSMIKVELVNPSDRDEQHITSIYFDPDSNKAGHFQLAKVMVGTKEEAVSDIVVPPSAKLTLQFNYAPLDLKTTVADYAGWRTGYEERWIPKKPDEESEDDEKENTVIHRSIMLITYDYPKDGYSYIQLIGHAVPGPNGEISAGNISGACFPGGGTACYTGGFAIDIPSLYATGPKDLDLAGAVKFDISGGQATLNMDEFPIVLMYLRSEEIPDLPPGTTATLVISGSPGEVATGTFDGSRVEIEGVSLRVRVVLGEVNAEDVTPGMAAMVDFVISGITMTTISPLESGNITLHMETTLGNSPSGNPLFDTYLSGAKIIGIMSGQLAM